MGKFQETGPEILAFEGTAEAILFEGNVVIIRPQFPPGPPNNIPYLTNLRKSHSKRFNRGRFHKGDSRYFYPRGRYLPPHIIDPTATFEDDPPVLNQPVHPPFVEDFIRSGSLRRVKPQINRNLSSLRRESTEETIEALIKHLEEVYEMLDYLDAKRMFSLEVEEGGLPTHGSYCGALDGQFLTFVVQRDSNPTIVAVSHGLGRKPQGAIWIYQVDPNFVGEVLIEGETIYPAANKQIVYFKLFGSPGHKYVCVLF